ncbi:MAG: sigma-70 family RNA polymerase sigma factor [Acidobacteria bacterium]|nr:sigma-70 family RNA polymerase sigma factor [Acidobacteriota bacterium]
MSVDLEDIVGELAPRLLRYATGRTSDSGLGEEVAQEALAALVQRWRRFGPPDSPEAFVFAIARRRAGRAVLRRRLSLPLAVLALRPVMGPDPEAEAVSNATARKVRAALARLSRLDRESLLLVTAGDLRAADAARLLGISESGVRMRTLRARRRLAALLEDRHGPRR